MLKQPELTVIMPCYNMEKYLPRAFEHLANQTDSNFKLLIINDGSTDKTVEVAEKFRDKFEFFNLITIENSGPAEARNIGMNYVDTPYFTFHDGDDWVDSDFTKFFVEAFHAHPDVAMVSCSFWIDYQDRPASIPATKKKYDKKLTKFQAYRELINPMGSFFCNHAFTSPVKGYSWNKGYKTSIVRKHNLRFVKDIAFMEDEIFNAEYMAVSDGFYCSSKSLYHYWQRKDSIIHDFNLKMVPDNFKANYLVFKAIGKYIANKRKETKIAKSKARELIRANEGRSNERES